MLIRFAGGTGAFRAFLGSGDVSVTADGGWHWVGDHDFGSS
jgi:hypothetical protein